MNWEKIKLGDIATNIQTGPFGSQLHQSDYSEIGIPVVMPKDMIEGKIIEQSIARVAEHHVNRLSRHKVNDGDILYARRGDVGRCVLVTHKEEGWLCGTGCLKVSIDLKKANPQFIFYQLQKPAAIGWVEKHAVGATMPNLNTGILENVPIEMPNLQVQNKIVGILSAYDNLIENNNKRIKILEQMAENLYKEWFVRFRFPGHETTPIENGIPKGWNERRLGDCMLFNRGTSYSSEDIVDGDLALLSMNNIRPYGGYIADYSRSFSGKYKTEQVVHENDLIMSITDMTQDRRIIGYVGLVSPTEKKCVICTHLMKISSSVYHNYFLYGLFTFSGLSKSVSEQATGTNVLGLTAKILNKIKCVIPEIKLTNLYSQKVAPIFEEIHSIEKQNENLIKQRDLLLPRLMSGKLAV